MISRLRQLRRYVNNNPPDVLVALGIVVGWASLTLGLVLATGDQFWWFLSLGTLTLGLVGYRFLARLFVNGLYIPYLKDNSPELFRQDEESQ